MASNASTSSKDARARGDSGEAERTVIGFDLTRDMVLLDRRLSGGASSHLTGVDADVRAGPWPDGGSGGGGGGGGAREVSVHAYVDHAVVSFIAGNQTAISAWVAPQRVQSVGLALFSELGAGEVTAVSIDVWQLASPTHATRR